MLASVLTDVKGSSGPVRVESIRIALNMMDEVL